MFSDLRFDKLITPTSEEKLSTAFQEVFDQYARVTKTLHEVIRWLILTYCNSWKA